MAKYPQDVYDSGNTLLLQIGTFWNSIFSDSNKLRDMFKGNMQEAAQTYRKFLEYLATAAKADCPVYAKENWHYITVTESELTTEDLRYGNEIFYGTNIYYGVRIQSSTFSVEAPGKLKSVDNILDRLIDPKVAWTAGVDFKLEDDMLYFRHNPFSNDNIPTNNILDKDGNLIDRELGLWLFNSEFDLQYLWQHYGYALGIFMNSSEYYKEFINAIADAYRVGPAIASIKGLLQAMTGVPLVKEPVEAVEKVLTSDNRTIVVTDKNVYRFNPGVGVIVSEGDTIFAGDALTDSLQVFELFDYIPEATELPALVLGKSLSAGSYNDELVVINEDVDLEYEGLDEDGKAIVKFQVSGRSADVDKFWDDVHTKGKANGKVLAEYLDTRENPSTPPVPAYLPATINPLRFVLSNFMKNNMFIIRMKINDFDTNAPGVGWFKSLRRIMAPHTTYIVYIEFNPEDEYINLTDSSEEINLFDADAEEEELTEAIMSESILLREVLNCN